jgi:hypothetical protein
MYEKEWQKNQYTASHSFTVLFFDRWSFTHYILGEDLMKLCKLISGIGSTWSVSWIPVTNAYFCTTEKMYRSWENEDITRIIARTAAPHQPRSSMLYVLTMVCRAARPHCSRLPRWRIRGLDASGTSATSLLKKKDGKLTQIDPPFKIK